jgi:hypothetical protein
MYAGENDGGVVPVQPTLGGGATPAAAVDTTAESSRVANISWNYFRLHALAKVRCG